MSQLTFHVDMLKMISYALHYNNIPFIQRIVIGNDGTESIKDAILKIEMESDIVDDYEVKIDEIEAGKGVILSRPYLKMSYEKLSSYNEKMMSDITFTVLCGEEVLIKETYPMEILPYDHWMGTHILPELISSFVTPNNVNVTELVVKASQELEKLTGSSSFTGYMSQNVNQVMAQLQALYQAVWKHHIIYTPIKTSFENFGQRVRMPKDVIRLNTGNCIEMSCLYASLMEAIGLHPLIVIIEGHAYVGCWSKEETFSECVIDDLATIEKFSAEGIHDIVLFESTISNQDQFISFEEAMKVGKTNLAKNFQLIVDVKRCRGSGIRPFPEASEDLQKDHILDERNQEIHDKNIELSITNHLASISKAELTRIQTWERKLLDMSLRNPLINVRMNKNALQLMVTDLHLIEDELNDGKEYQVLGAPEDLQLPNVHGSLIDTSQNESYLKQLMQSEFKSKRMRSFNNAQTTELIMRNLYRASRLSIEENGTNTLYMALGFLKWYENDISEKERYAPLLLIPIEVIRKSAKSGYVIRERDEDVLFNETLLEMLKQDFKLEINGLSTLPVDESGVDVKLVFHIVTQAIKNQKRWKVMELATIGLFSFKQFVMWNDLRNRSDDLAANKVVKSLMDGQISWEVEDVLEGVDFDKEYKPSDLALPVDVDSSQLSAVCLADKGQSFILHGPPGTGKSQTITNMIANALYHNKSVLFIAEKSAALNVVRKRLEKIGLGPFCLELHSDKARKRDVLSQLDQTLELGQLQYPQDYATKADELYALRCKLDGLMESIHYPTKFGKSLYEYMNRAEELVDVKDVTLFTSKDLNWMNEANMQQKQQWINEYGVAARQIDACHHPLKDIDVLQYSLVIKEQLETQSNQLLDALSNLQDNESLYTLLNMCENESQLVQMLKVIELYEQSPIKDPILFDFDMRNQHTYAINQWFTYLAEEQTMEQELSSVFHLNTPIPYQQIQSAYHEATNSFFLMRGMNEKKVIKQLASYAKNPTVIDKSNLITYCSKLAAYDQAKQNKASQATTFQSVYGRWMNDANQLKQLLETQSQLETAYRECPARNEVKAFLLQATDAYASKVSSIMKLAQEQAQYVTYRKDVTYLEKVLKLNVLLQMHSNELREFVLYSEARKQLEQENLMKLVAGYETSQYALDELQSIFEKSATLFVVEYLMSEKEDVMKFTYESMCDVLKRYRDTTSMFQQLTKEELAARLSSRIPTIKNLSNSSEIAILKRAIKSNGRAMSIRKLFDQIPNLLRRLTPCMLMSPMSVAQYIDPKYPKFDLVIFDEASQLPTSSAVGAIARGENLIVVGDPKQMPPTSFFQAQNVDEENLEQEDLESILDDCLSLSMPQLYLSWHYRSEHESLISFSNMQFYENRLMTFPSVENQKSMVKFVEVKGTYRKGKNRVNVEEAKAIIEEIKRRLMDETLCHQSIGVVTFNVTQQLLIDDLLMEEFRNDKVLEERANALYEPIFIKNLENVQGDERDVILFSICYGPDEDGRVSMNFGPINRDGGERRLNVAVSRSRKEMVVFSTLLPHQIDLNRTRARGAAELKAFLEYAMNGKLNQSSAKVSTIKDTYVEKIAEVLRTEGYDVNTFVGNSRFKVDIAIKDPQNSENYLVGIMLDGLQYASAITTRDRSISQISVLKRLGWDVMELFILDWWEHRSDVLARIKQFMEDAKQKQDVQVVEAPKKNDVFEFKKAEVEVEVKTYPKYVMAQLKPCRGGAEAAALAECKWKLMEQMVEVLDVEAPISEEELFHRVMEAWGVTRIGPRLKTALANAAQDMAYKDNLTQSPCTKKVFYWGSLSPQMYTTFRIPTEAKRRPLDLIPYEELMNAAKEVLTVQFSMNVDDLKRETAKMFGWTKVTSATTEILDHVVGMMVRREIAVIEEQKVHLK